MFDRGHLDHVALNVGDYETFEMLRRRLVAAGVTDGMVTDFGNVRTIWFRDPDGGEGEIAQWQRGAPLTFAERRQYHVATSQRRRARAPEHRFLHFARCDTHTEERRRRRSEATAQTRQTTSADHRYRTAAKHLCAVSTERRFRTPCWCPGRNA
jgi:hypothetical protein